MLRDLSVRADASRKLHLPMVLKQGSVDFVRIQASWRVQEFFTVVVLSVADCLVGIQWRVTSYHSWRRIAGYSWC